jgi:hypothetical protein
MDHHQLMVVDIWIQKVEIRIGIAEISTMESIVEIMIMIDEGYQVVLLSIPLLEADQIIVVVLLQVVIMKAAAAQLPHPINLIDQTITLTMVASNISTETAVVDRIPSRPLLTLSIQITIPTIMITSTLHPVVLGSK